MQVAGEVARRFCPACNVWIPPGVEGERCPRCHSLTFDGFDATAHTPTITIRDGIPEAETIIMDDQLTHLIGSRLDVYLLESRLGHGAMGQVFLASHEHLGRKCAVKVLMPKATRDPKFLQRFLNEGRAAASLVHPNIVTTHAIGGESGVYFLEMEFVGGRSLQRLLLEEGRLDPLRATAICARVADGLAAAHREGVVHRDIKLENILLTMQGAPKLGDFGLAKPVVGIADDLAGTPNYMAPELFQGEQPSFASDVYALGVCYFLLLTGHFPYGGASLNELMDAAIHAPLPNVRKEFPEIPLEMTECLAMLLAKAPSNRPQNGIAAAQLLDAVCGQMRDFHSLMHEAFDGVPGLTWKRGPEDGYRIDVEIPDGRRQAITLEPSDHSLSERLILISSICCDAQPAYYEQALRLNSDIPHGGLAIRDVDGHPKFVMVDTYPRATVDSEEIRRSVLEVAARADAVEKLLTGKDVH